MELQELVSKQRSSWSEEGLVVVASSRSGGHIGEWVEVVVLVVV